MASTTERRLHRDQIHKVDGPERKKHIKKKVSYCSEMCPACTIAMGVREKGIMIKKRDNYDSK